MPRIQFIENDLIKPPYISLDVRFDNYGESKEVREEVAISLLTDHPDKFRAIDGFSLPKSESSKVEENMIKIKFCRNDYFDKYISAEVSFDKIGEVKEVREEVARRLLTEHSDKFELAEDYSDKAEELPKKQEATISEEQESDSSTQFEDQESVQKRVIELLSSSSNDLSMIEIGDALDINWRSLPYTIKELVSAGKIKSKKAEIDGKNKKVYSIKS